MKTRLLTILLTLLPLMAWGQSTNEELYDGDLFTAETIEGVTLTYKVISAANKTCQVGGGEYNVKACDVNTTGTITVPEVAKGFQVITIGGYAFSDCSKLTQINLPETIKTITYRAFSNCSGLTSFTIPNSVTRFDGNHQWNGCTGLTSIHIPANVTSMGNHTFANCPNILEVTVDENNPVFESPAGSHAIINKGKKSVVQGFKNTVIPEGITYIESAAFVGNEYNDIVLPKSFEGFYWDAFEYNAVHSITVAEGNTLFDSRNNCNALMETATDKLVKGCANTMIPSETKVIGEYAFVYAYESNDYPSLKTVVLPEGLTKIEKMAFGYCKDLEEVTIPSTVTEIMDNAFVRSDNMKTLVSYIQEPFALGNYVFDDTQCQNIILYVPQGTKSLYEAAEGWNQIKNIREIGSSNAEPYAVLSENNTVLTFYYDDQRNVRGGIDINNKYIAEEGHSPYETATSAIFDESFADYRPTSTAYWFMNCSSLTSINDIQNLKTDNVTEMGSMFRGCSGLTSLDVSGFTTDNVTDMGLMFLDCSSLTSLDVSGFNTDNVDFMYNMFCGCSSLVSLDVTGFKTEKVTDMGQLFFECSSLKSLDVSSFNTQNVTNMGLMFSGCSGLTSLDVTGFNTQNVTNMNSMFRGCSGLTSLDVIHFNTANVTGMRSMFSGCSGLTSLDVSHFNTEKVTIMSAMFSGCSGLSSLDVSHFNTEKVTGMDGMFVGCSSLTNLDVSHFNTANVTDMSGMFQGCSSLTSLDVSYFNTANVTDMSWMFYNCSGLKTIYVGEEWNTSAVTKGGYMFTDCTKLVGGAGTTYDANHTDYTYARIDGGPNNPGYFTDKNAVAAPTFRFEGDNLVIETATKDASIFYQMADLPNMDEATIEKIKEGLTVTADAQQSIYYEQPIELKKSVVLKAIAAGAKNSEVSTLVYDYDVWQKLLAAIDYGMDVSGRASDNSNVPDEMKEQLTHMLEEGKWVYDERMWESNAVNNLTNEIMQLAHQIDEVMTVVTEPEPYAVLSENNTVLTFYYDEKKEERNGMSIGPFANETERGWDEYEGTINIVIFDDSFASCSTITSTAYWFASCYNSLSIHGISNLKTDNVTDMTMMFHSTWLKDIDVSGFNTSKVTSMRNMFSGCSMSSLDVSNFNTENVTDFSGMFSSNSHLTSLDLKNFNTANATSMSTMFSGCTQLTSIDISSFNTANVTNMNNMFSSCTNLQNLDLSHFKTEKVRDIRRMFLDCRNLISLDVSSFKTDSVLSMELLFENCSKLESLDLSSFNTKDIWEMRYMFDGCTSLKTIYVGNEWSTEKVSSGENMFRNCTSLVGGAGTTYDANHVDHIYARIDGGPNSETPGYFTLSGDAPYIEPEPYAVLSENNTVLTFYYDGKKKERNGMEMGAYDEQGVKLYASATKAVFDPSFANDTTLTTTSAWFYGCDQLKEISGLQYVNTSKVTNMANMFQGCRSLQTVDVSKFDTRNVENMNNLFDYCSSLTSLDLSNFNTEKVKTMDYMFVNCHNLTSLKLSSFDTRNVKSMRGMFSVCRSLSSLDLSNFNTESLETTNEMFYYCSSLSSLDLSSFNTKNVNDMYIMFFACISLKTIYVSDQWTTASVTEGGRMFYGCVSLVGGKGTKFNAMNEDYTYAHIDEGPSNPGYLTRIGDEPYQMSWVDQLANGDAEKPWVNPNTRYDDLQNNYKICAWGKEKGVNMNDDGGWDPFPATIEEEEGTNGNHVFVVHGKTADTAGDASAWDNQFWIQSPQAWSVGTPIWIKFRYKASKNVVANTQVHKQTPSDYLHYEGIGDINFTTEWQQFNGILIVQSEMDGFWSIAFNLNSNEKSATDFYFDDLFWSVYQEKSEEPESYATFDSNGVLTVGGSISLADALSAAGGRAEVAKTITAVVWNSTATLTNDDLQGLDNPNMLIYVKDATFAPTNRDNVVIGDFAKNIVLTDVESGNNNFYCPKEFKAEMISYTRNFQQQTEVGVSRGWESIALPFTVQTMMHEKNGLIAPFGNDASGKHFWLRQLTQEGLARATAIEANTPYIISMPNSSEYPADYCLNGRVTFSSQDALVPVTSGNIASHLDAVTNTMIVLYPAMQRVAQNEEVYALNVGSAQAGYAEGSVFVAGLRDVRPFECYTWHHAHGPAPRYIPIDEMNGGATGIEDVRGQMSDGRSESWYDLSGRKLQKKPTQNGVYILNGRRVVIK